MMILFLILLAPALASVESLSYSGRLVNTNGSPVTGPVNLRFELSYTDDPSTVICSKDLTAVPLTNGVFHTRLDFTSGECGGAALQTVLAAVPTGESAAVKVTDLTNSKAYTLQSLHAVPFSLMASMAKTLERMGASTGQVLKWDGTQWAPGSDDGGAGGNVTSVGTGTGLVGGPITATGTISIANGGVDTTQLADSAVTNVKVAAAAAIARTKLASGSNSHVLVNDSSGVMSSVAQLPIAQGGTGSSTAAGARTALELGSAASANVGMGPSNVIRPSDISICNAGEYLRLNVGPTYFWTCHSDASTDGSKLPLAGGTMSGDIAMGTNKITGLGTPTAVADAATKAYVDSSVSDVSHWTLSSGNVTRSTGHVGIGTLTASEVLTVVGGNISVTDPAPTATEPYVGGSDFYRYQPIDNGGRSGVSSAHSFYVNIDSNNDSTSALFSIAKDSNSFAAGTELFRIQENGAVGLGVVVPTASLHLRAGTASASTAPLKFTAGTNLTTPEAGAVEFDGTNLYFTDSTATRRTLSTSTGSFGSGSTILSASGSVSAPGLSFSGDTDTGLYSSGANQMAVTAGGAQLFTFDSNGMLASASGGGVVSSAAGTASAPTFSFAGDTDTGWFSPAANQLAASNSGVESVRINASGNLGIGTSSVARKLTVQGGAADNLTARFVSGAGTTDSNIEFKDPNTTADYKVMIGSVGDGYKVVAGGSERMRILSSGNVGIGTSSPGAKLNVIGAAVETPTILSMDESSYSILHLVTLGHSSTGYGTIGDGYKTTATTNSYKYVRNDYATMLDFASGNIRFKTAPIGVDGNVITYETPMTILNTGNIGMGVDAPTGVLHLSAGSSAAGAAPLKLTAGTNLTTPEAGAMEFDGSVLYFTTGTTRHVIPFAGATGSFTDITNISNSSGNITMSPSAGTGSVLLSGAASTGVSSGALIVSGGIGVSGAINSSSNISADGIITSLTSMVSPQIYGSSAAGGDLLIDGTSHAAKGDVLLATAGGNVGIGTTSPQRLLSLFASSTPVLQLTNSTAGTGSNDGLLIFQTGLNSYIENREVGSLFLRTQTADRLTIDADGEVGIGTTVPSAKLDVVGGSNGSNIGILRLQNNSGSSANTGASIEFYSRELTPAQVEMARIGTLLQDGTAGASRADLVFSTINAGTLSEKARITGAGYFGIATTSPESPLHVKGGSALTAGWNETSTLEALYPVQIFNSNSLKWAGIGYDYTAAMRFWVNANSADVPSGTQAMSILNSGNVGIGFSAPAEKLEVNGNVKAVSFISTSDRRLKTELVRSQGLDVIKRLTGLKFKWRDSGAPERGVMAQDVERVMPEAVVTNAQTGIKSVKYNNLFAPVIEALKELFVMVSGQNGQLATLSQQVKGLEVKDRQLRELQLENRRLEQRLAKLEALVLRQGKAGK